MRQSRRATNLSLSFAAVKCKGSDKSEKISLFTIFFNLYIIIMFRKLNFQELTLAPCGASNFVSGVQEFSLRSGVQTMALCTM